MSLLNAYIQQSSIESINLHHEFYAMKIQQISKDFISLFHSQTPEQHLLIMNSLYRTVERLKNYKENLEKQKVGYETKPNSIEGLTKQQNEYTYPQKLIMNMERIINETLNQFNSLLIPNLEQEKSLKLFNQLKERGFSQAFSSPSIISISFLAINTIIQSSEYNRLSKHISPHLLILHEYTSGQELISLTPPSIRNLFQLGTQTHIQQELPSQTYLLQRQSSINFQKDFSNPKTQILQTEINYLQKQHAEAIARGDLTQQLAAERAISNKLQTMEQFQEKPIPPVQQQSSITNKTDQQIHELMKKHVKSIQRHIRSSKSKLNQKTIHSVENLRQLSINF